MRAFKTNLNLKQSALLVASLFTMGCSGGFATLSPSTLTSASLSSTSSTSSTLSTGTSTSTVAATPTPTPTTTVVATPTPTPVATPAPTATPVATPVPVVATAATCINGGDQTTINNAFKAVGSVATLCANSTFNLTGPVVFNAANQILMTQGLPTDGSRATLRITGASAATAIQGYNSGIQIRNIIIDGNRTGLGYMAGDFALMDVGGASSNQIYDHIKAYEPRGWSILHNRQRDVANNNNCLNATVTNNDFGPAGHGAPINQLADGISLTCRASYVAGNTITDATDGAIVIFGAGGSTIRDNLIQTQNRILSGAINLEDFAPYAGDYNGVVVTNNTILATGGFIKTGIAMGPGVAGLSYTQDNAGAVISGNTLGGANMGYGIAVYGVSNFSVHDNVFNASYGGDISTCPAGTAAPQAYVIDASRASGSYFQPGYTIGGTYAVQGCLLASAPVPVISRNCNLASLAAQPTTGGNRAAYEYCEILGRNIDAGALQTYAANLDNGTLTMQQLELISFNSTEFQGNFQIASLTSSQFVYFLYQTLLNRVPDASGMAAYTAALDAGQTTRANLFATFVSGAEFKNANPLLY